LNSIKDKQADNHSASTPSGQPSPAQSTKVTPNSQKEAKPARTPMPAWIRIPLILLRTLLVPFLCVTALIVGVVFGYVYMGGRDSSDVWNMETWRHLFELVFAS